jgi:hypothetical protein
MQTRERKIVKWVISITITLVVISFGLFQSKNLIAGPKIEIISPINGRTAEESLTKIRGKAKNISEIKLNGRNIFVDEKGIFEEKVLLSYGYNSIIIEAKDRFNRTTKKELQLVLK